jgi:FkbM family methyltransferase
VRRGDTVIDAGANVGYMTLLTAIAAGPSGRVVAWEPHPELFGVLQQNARSLAASVACAHIDLRNAALGERAGTADLIVPPDIVTNDGLSYVGSRVADATAIAVPLEKIDDACDGQSISVLKLDVEGSEQRVLDGACRLLRGGRILNIVFEDHDGQASAVIPKLMSFGYEVFSIGWSVAGPRLGTVARARLSADYEAPSYLATLLPEEALRLCSGAGWRTLRQRFARMASADEPSEYRRECA